MIDDRLRDGNVIIDKWELGIVATTAEDTDTSKTKTTRSNCFSGTIGLDFNFFALQGYKFSVDTVWCARLRSFIGTVEKSELLRMLSLTSKIIRIDSLTI